MQKSTAQVMKKWYAKKKKKKKSEVFPGYQGIKKEHHYNL